jgi:prephenate dehydrogenase
MAEWPLLPIVQADRQAPREAIFERVAVVGLCGLGRAVAAATRQAFPSALVIGADRNDRLEACVRSGWIDIGAEDPIVVAEADLVLLDVPLTEQEIWLAAIPDLIPGGATLATLRFDRALPGGAAALPERFRFVAGHVTLASPLPDLQHVTAATLVGARWAFADARTAAAPSQLESFVRALGARPIVVSTGAELAALALEDAAPAGARDDSSTPAV